MVVEADGGSRGNPGPAGYGAVLKDAASGDVIAEAAASIGRATNNVAEYRGLVAGLELWAQHAPSADLEVRMDSKLVVEQMAGRWKIKHPDLRPLALTAQRLAPPRTRWTWVPRALNADADRLANLAMDAAARGETYTASPDSGSPSDGSPPNNDEPGRFPDTTGSAAQPTERPEPSEVESAASAGSAKAVPTSSARNPMPGWSDALGPATTLMLVRHGQTANTVARVFCGPGGGDPGLNDGGREQVRRAAETLAASSVDAVLTSPMRRARETADLIAAEIGLPVVVADGYRECAFGAWDGLTLQQVREQWPGELDSWLDFADARPPDGESIAEAQQRVEAELQSTLSAYAGKTVVIVSHVNPIKLVVRACLEAPLHCLHRMLVSPASLTVVSFYESGDSVLHQLSAPSPGASRASTSRVKGRLDGGG